MTPVTKEKLQQALQLHQAGRVAEAQQIYEQVLAEEPDNADALHLLGLLLSQKGQHEIGLESIDKAIALNPKAAGFFVSRGSVLAALGRGDESECACRRAGELVPNNAEIENNVGTVYLAAGKLTEAEAAFRRAVGLTPENPDMQFNLGNALRAQNRAEEAVATFRRTVELKPDHSAGLYHLGKALTGLGRAEEAVAVFEQASRLRADSADVYAALGEALRLTGRFEQAVAAYRRFCELRPQEASGQAMLGRAIQECGRLDEAISLLREVLERNPESAEAHVQLGVALLLQGELAAGWNEYQWIWEVPDPKQGRRQFARPRWKAAPVEGLRMLVHSEAGFGDAILWARYVPMLAERAGNVVLESPRPLRRVFASLRGRHRLITAGETIGDYDVHCPMMHLPAIFGTTLETIPADVPYLSADAALTEQWRHRLGVDDRLKVGLVWAGDPQSPRDRQRSVKLSMLAPLGEVAGVRFISLQKGRASEEAAASPAGMTLIDWSAELGDFADTAALMANLDLVVTVDTAAAHLAGAMGKPVWVMLSRPEEWRWMIGREDSPWYPTMRLFRQKAMGDWSAPVQQAAWALRSLAEERRAARP
jgi:tetratricopeptide (TPR) repeat protein